MTPLTNNPVPTAQDRPGIPTIPPAGAEAFPSRTFANVSESLQGRTYWELTDVIADEGPSLRAFRQRFDLQAIRKAAAEMDAEAAANQGAL